MDCDFKYGIIGSGISGITALLKLIKSGEKSLVLFEKAKEIGGTWRENIYPGCACDSSNLLYSISGELDFEWKERYAKHDEILSYLKHIIAKYRMDNYINTNVEVKSIKFLEDKGIYEILDSNSILTTCKFLILATGTLNVPFYPDFKNKNNFEGAMFHSAKWNNSVNLKNKTVAVIGTGASAIQIVPSIANMVKKLYVVQRSPAWVFPKPNKEISKTSKAIHRLLPGLKGIHREIIFWTKEIAGTSHFGNKLIQKLTSNLIIQNIKNTINDLEIANKLIPNYTIGCKSALKSNEYYKTFNKANVELITEPIVEILPTGFKIGNGKEFNADVIIYATGFQGVKNHYSIEIIGKNKLSLSTYLNQSKMSAYLGFIVPHFPNLFLIMGPNSRVIHNSILQIVESQLNYIVKYSKFYTKTPQLKYLEIKESVLNKYADSLKKRFQKSIWNDCDMNRYMDEKNKNVSLFPGLCYQYRRKTKVPKIEDFTPY